MLLFSILFTLLVFLLLLFALHRRWAITQVEMLSEEERLSLLNETIEPFGFRYDPNRDIFTSLHNAWQKEVGYRRFYDENAHHVQMILDCEPIYFDWEDRTWLIQFWKGQYGITTGTEVGIYRADRLLSVEERAVTRFMPVFYRDQLPIYVEVYRNNQLLYRNCDRHWWLTGFCMGLFTEPEQLSMRIRLIFPSSDMAKAFLSGAEEAGYGDDELLCRGNQIIIHFDVPKTQQPSTSDFLIRFAQVRNRLFCRAYLWITRPFGDTCDRLIYLLFRLPFVFRRTIFLRNNKDEERKARKARNSMSKNAAKKNRHTNNSVSKEEVK